MSDVIRLRGVRADGCHGVLDWEKRQPQPFVVDVDLALDLTWAGVTDALSDTVDYGALAHRVAAVIEGPPVDLIETLAARIAQTCLDDPLVEAADVTVHKPQAPIPVPFGDVAARVRRERRRAVVIALGANLGEPERTLTAAVRALDRLDGVRVRGVSGLFETDPVGEPGSPGDRGPDQPRYLNAVMTAQTRLHPRTLLRRLHELEDRFGRVREVRWGPRTLDLDLVQAGEPGTDSEVRSDAAALTLPHPRAHQRGFVLAPWAEVEPRAMLRVGDRVAPVAALLSGLGRAPGDVLPPGVRRGPIWEPLRDLSW